MDSERLDRASLLDRARLAHEEVGLGVIVMLLQDVAPRYVTAEEIKASLADAQVEPELLLGVVSATAKYDPKWEAVLVLEQEDCLTITIVGHKRSAVVTYTAPSCPWGVQSAVVLPRRSESRAFVEGVHDLVGTAAGVSLGAPTVGVRRASRGSIPIVGRLVMASPSELPARRYQPGVP